MQLKEVLSTKISELKLAVDEAEKSMRTTASKSPQEAANIQRAFFKASATLRSFQWLEAQDVFKVRKYPQYSYICPHCSVSESFRVKELAVCASKIHQGLCAFERQGVLYRGHPSQDFKDTLKYLKTLEDHLCQQKNSVAPNAI